MAEDKISQWWELDRSTATGSVSAVADSIANYVSGLGTEADSTTAGRPTLCGRLDTCEITALYVNDDLSRRIVEEVVEDATRGGWRVTDRATGTLLDMPDDMPDITTAQKQAGIWGRCYGAGVIVMVPEGATVNMREPRDPATPIRNLVVFDRHELTTAEWDTDPFSPTFNQPLRVNISPQSSGGVRTAEMGALRNVHRSWLLVYGGAPLPHQLRSVNDGFDDSILQAVWNVIRRFLQAEQGIANIINRFETATLSIGGLAAALSADEGAHLIQKRMALIQQTVSMVNAVVVDADAGEKYERKFATVQGLDVLWDRLAHSVAKAAGMPMVALFGMAPSGLSADDKSGRANWRKRVAAYQKAQFKGNLETFYRAFNGGKPVSIEFFPLDETTPAEEVLNRESTARSIGLLVGNGVLSRDEARDMLREEGSLRSDAPAPELPAEEPNPAQPVGKSNGFARVGAESTEAPGSTKPRAGG